MAIPPDKYCWRPAEPARSVSAVLIHIAGGNFGLLDLVGQRAPEDVYGKVDEGLPQRFWTLIRKNEALEVSAIDKRRVVELLQRSFAAMCGPLSDVPEAEL